MAPSERSDDSDYVDGIPDPPFARALFKSLELSWLWVPVRAYLGYAWLSKGLDQFSDPAWMDGSAVLTFWWDALDVAGAGAPSATYGGYRGFLGLLVDADAEALIARLVVFAELAVGLALVVGAFVGIAAFLGAFMNMNFMLAGTTATNPLLFLGAVGLMLAWRVAGYYGLDRWILPSVGTPWAGTRRRAG
jgi:thiosulfate dehydrogenase [quinone] large subunit